MVGGDDLDRAFVQAAPERLAVGGRLERRVHLGEGAEPAVVGDIEEEVVRADLGRYEVAVLPGEDSRLFRRGDVQDVETAAVAPWPGRSRAGWRRPPPGGP